MLISDMSASGHATVTVSGLVSVLFLAVLGFIPDKTSSYWSVIPYTLNT